MNAKQILQSVVTVAIVGGLAFNQWRLQQRVERMPNTAPPGDHSSTQPNDAAAKLRQAETSYHEAQTQLQIAGRMLAGAQAQLAELEQRVQQLEGGGTQRTGFRPRLMPTDKMLTEPTTPPPGVKRSWGPEQVVGEPDTLQAGDISTAWAPLEQNGGEEWLKLDYENSVDIAEVRVRETHNPGAVSKVTAILADGSEVTIWEGVEPKSEPPVEMAFAVPNSVNAKSVKIYLDTKRVPGWNEIDAVQLIGRDGSQQWAKQASASSTYAEQGGGRRLIEFDNLGPRTPR